MKRIHQHENQITRLCLTGSGIVCGLDVYVDEDYGIYIRSGNGLTSNGQYIEVKKSKWFRYYRPYENDTYPLFQGAEVWELKKHAQGGEPLKPQSSEEEFNPFLRNKIVLLFAEEDEQSGGSVTRFLLMDQDQLLEKLNLQQLTTQILWDQIGDDDDFIYNDDYNPDDTRPRVDTLNLAVNPALRLPELYLRRFGFGKGDPFDCPPEGVDASEFPCKEELKDLNGLYNAYVPIIDEATIALDKALNQVHDYFSPLMDLNKEQRVREWIDLLCEKWEAYKMENEEETIGTKYYIQYFYDWVRDLIQAYNELRLEIIDLVIACCANVDEFPQHLLLGIAFRDDLSRQPKPLRHTFRQPPIYNGNADRLQRMRLYCWRVLMMIKGFYLPDYINDESINPYCEPSQIDEEDAPDFSTIKITPGRFYDAPLAEQTIPYYYPVTWSRYSVHHFWNYDRTRTSSTNHLLSYHASDLEDSYTQVLSAVRPLHYSLNKYSFFRVEGHIGKLLKDVYRTTLADGQTTVENGVWSTLKYLKTKYNLPIYFNYINIEELVPVGKYEFPKIQESRGGACPEVIDLAGEPERFCSFICKMLGAEHQAGVKEGGTFILVYQMQDVDGIPDKAEVVIADFFLPCCYNDCNVELDVICINEGDAIRPPIIIEDDDDLQASKETATKPSTTNDSKKPPKKVGVKEKKIASQVSLLAALGKADPAKKDNLKAIKGIGPAFERNLNDIGIYTYDQVSKLTDETYDLLDDLISQNNRGRAKRDDWAKNVQKLLKKKPG